MTPNARWRLPHRPGLDGVRALAVLGVLLYHGGVDWLPGGFLGVDVFFVLSGFLITSLLLREHEVTGRVNLPDFWFRRACRLLPALVPVVIFVAGYAVTLAPDVVRDRLRGDLFATVGYVANWRFVIADTSYFEQYAAPTPLLHAWSLAIEEQFYLLWPLVLLLLLRRGGGARGTRRLTSLIAGGALASALTMALIYRPGFDPSRVYYGTDTRAQALLVGAAGAVIAVRGGLWAAEPEHRMARWSATMGLTGLVGLAVLGVAARDSAPWLYRGGFVLGALAALALVAGTVGAPGSALSRILAGAPLRIVGVASYGIYLWHWPVYVVLTPDRTDLSGPALLMLRLGITALLASVSYVLVEAPIRRWQPSTPGAPWTRVVRQRALVAGLALGGLIVVATSDGLRPLPAGPEVRAAPATPLPATASQPRPSPGTTPPNATTPLKVFLLGDSVAYGLHTDAPPEPGLNITASGVTLLGCNQFPGNIAMGDHVVPLQANCSDWPRQWMESLAAVRPDVAVMMPGNGEFFDHIHDGRRVGFQTPEYEQHLTQWLTRTTEALAVTGARVAVTDLPCYAKADTGFDQTASVINDRARQEWLNGVIAKFVAQHPEVTRLELRSIVCPTGHYQEVVGGVRIYKDGVHWTPEGARFVWSWLAGQARAISG